MAEQKKTNEALNVEDALTQSEAFLIKNKKTIIGAILAIIIIIAKFKTMPISKSDIANSSF